MSVGIFIFHIQRYSNMHMEKYVYSCFELCLKHNVLFKCKVDFKLSSTFHGVKLAIVVKDH